MRAIIIVLIFCIIPQVLTLDYKYLWANCSTSDKKTVTILKCESGEKRSNIVLNINRRLVKIYVI